MEDLRKSLPKLHTKDFSFHSVPLKVRFVQLLNVESKNIIREKFFNGKEHIFSNATKELVVEKKNVSWNILWRMNGEGKKNFNSHPTTRHMKHETIQNMNKKAI